MAQILPFLSPLLSGGGRSALGAMSPLGTETGRSALTGMSPLMSLLGLFGGGKGGSTGSVSGGSSAPPGSGTASVGGGLPPLGGSVSGGGSQSADSGQFGGPALLQMILAMLNPGIQAEERAANRGPMSERNPDGSRIGYPY